MSENLEMPTEETPVLGTPSISIREARQRVGMTVEQLSRRTRITARIISALETGERERLPAPVFVRGYLRAIASELDAEVGPWLDPWSEASTTPGGTSGAAVAKKEPEWWQTRLFGEKMDVPVHVGHVLSVVLAILAFFFLYFAIEGGNSNPEDAISKDSRSLIETLDTRPIQGR